MSVVATVIAPLSYGQAVELASGLWAKRVLPVGSINYQGRQLHFTPEYLRGLENAFRSGAYDQVSFQLADAQNTHTNDPERHRGTIVDMKAQDDGLYVYVQPTPRGAQVLRENPNLGVSARIVEQYSRADGRHFPAAIQHVLGTLDPRVNGLGPWTELANSGGLVIDLSASRFPGDEPPAYASPLDALLDGLTEAEQLDALEAFYSADAGQLSDAELDALVAQAEADAARSGYEDPAMAAAVADFDQAFTDHYATAQAARANAELEDLMRPARRDEDVISRAVSRIGQGIYTPHYGLANEELAITLANSAGLCGPADPVTGLCGSRYHALGCAGHAAGSDGHVQLARSGAYADALDGLAVSLSGGDPYPDTTLIPAETIELARSLNEAWGLHGDPPPAYPAAAEPAAEDLFSQPRQLDAYSAMAAELGRDDLASPQPGRPWPDVSALRAGLGL